MKTATEVGGDYYYFFVDENNVLTGVIGDATGHGLNVGTMVTATKSLFVSHGDEENIVNMLEEFNRSLKKLNFRFLFMCRQVFRIKDYKFELTSAGMPRVFIHRKVTDEVEEILLKGLPLGSTSDTHYQHRETILQKGDTILFMSDGFPEVLDANGNMFGYEKIARVFKGVAGKDLKRLLNTWKKSPPAGQMGKNPMTI